MTLSSTTLNALQHLVERDPALQQQLQQSADITQAAKLLMQAAQAAQLTLSEADLHAHLERVSQQLKNTLLSDEQLNTVAGGMTHDGFIAMSVFSLGLGCHIMSYDRVQKGYIPARGEHSMSPEFCLRQR